MSRKRQKPVKKGNEINVLHLDQFVKVEQKMIHKTVLSCAGCFSMAVCDGKNKSITCCPNCGCKDPDLLRIRYWENGSPDYSKNLLKIKI